MQRLITKWISDRSVGQAAEVARGAVKLSAGAGIGQLLLLAVTPILSRLYTPDSFGHLAVFVSLIGLSLPVSTLRYELAIPLPRQSISAHRLLILSLSFLLFFSVIAIVAAWLCNGPFKRETSHFVAEPAILWLLAPALILMGGYQAVRMLSVRDLHFGRIGRVRIYQGGVGAVSQVTLGIIAPNPFTLVVGHIIANAAGIWRLIKGRPILATLRNSLEWSGICAVASRYRRFPLLLCPADIANVAGTAVVPLVLSAQYGPALAGQFFLAHRIVGAPVGLIAKSLTDSFIGSAAVATRDRPFEVAQLARRTALLIGFCALPPTLFVIFFGQELVAFVFGDRWSLAGLFVQYFGPIYFLKVVVDPATPFPLIERQDLALLWSTLRLLVVGILFWIAIASGQDGKTTVFWFACIFPITYLMKYWLWIPAVRKYGQCRIPRTNSS